MAAVTATPEAPPEARRQEYFDPPMPPLPEEVLGLNTDAVVHLGQVVTAAGVLPPAINVQMYKLPAALRVVPLLETLQEDPVASSETIRPYRKPLKKLAGVEIIDKVAAVTGLRRAVNRKLDKVFPEKTTDMLQEARELIAGMENEVEHIAKFDNPKEQFTKEATVLAETVANNTTAYRNARVRGEVAPPKPETPPGLAGLLVRVMRKVSSFFGWFKRKPAVNEHITAYDAGEGIRYTLQSFADDPEEAARRFPMLSKLAKTQLKKVAQLPADRLAFLAPEILSFLFSIDPKNPQQQALVESVAHNPHELRFITRYKRHFGRYSLDRIQDASTKVLPALRDVLPTSGAQVQETYQRAKKLVGLEVVAPSYHEEKSAQEGRVPYRKRLVKRLRQLRRK